MPEIAIITDTDCSIPIDLSEQLGIRQVPIAVQFGDETFEAGINLNDHQAFERIDRDGRLPSTAAPSPGQFDEAFRAAFDGGAGAAICFCVSSEISATYASAMNARRMRPGHDITVVDTQSLSMGQGFMVLAAAEAAAQGASAEEILAAAAGLQDRTHLFVALPTLKYLAMSGRVGTLAAGMASLLHIQPILTIQNGKLELLERSRTRKKAWNRVFENTRQALGNGTIERFSILHVDAPEAARDFEEMLRAEISCPQAVLYAELTPGLSVHAGAGLVGVAFVRSEG